MHTTTQERSGVVVNQPMTKIDLRSDTVSWPTFEMREAMANAVVGDDVWGDDPTTIELEKEAAAMLGKPAALFIPSGTQGNLLAMMCHCRHGDEAILGDKSHIMYYEAGGISALAGVIPRALPVKADGTIDLNEIKAAVRTVDVHFPITRIIALENTQNKMGGVSLPIDYINSVCAFAHENHLVVHMDGARIFNAAADLNVPVAEIVKNVDSVTFCLSKALCAPAGSILAGSEEFIKLARHKRKMLGGGMRQVGVLAAAGLVAIREMIPGLREDHRVAKILADGIAKIPGLKVKANNTNFVFFYLENAKLNTEQLTQQLKERNILVHPVDDITFRFLTYYWVTEKHALLVLEALKELLQ